MGKEDSPIGAEKVVKLDRALGGIGLKVRHDISQVQIEVESTGNPRVDGRFTDLAELGFVPQSSFSNPQPPIPNLRSCNGSTVNKVHGTEASIQKIREKYPEVQVESMEGAAFFYACLAAGVPFAEIRSISNRVEPRNRDAWDLHLSIRNLNEVLVGMLEIVSS